MNKIIILALMFTALISTGCFNSAEDETPAKINPQNVVKNRINMTGMTCGHCEAAIERLSSNKGVASIDANATLQRVDVAYDPALTDIHTIMNAIDKKGFTPVSYEDETGLHELNVSKEETTSTMKCGAGKCGGGKCGSGQ